MGQTNKYKLPYPEADDDANVPLDMKNLAEKIEEISDKIESTITDAYDTTKTYPVGSYCIHNNILYKCITAVANEEFDESKWEETNITKEVESLGTKTKNLDTRTRTVNVTTPGTDLNDYVQDGKWFFNIANTPTNKPSGITNDSGYLEVINRNAGNNSEIMQRWTTGNRFEIYIRQKSGGTWGEWGKLLAENDLKTTSINCRITPSTVRGNCGYGETTLNISSLNAKEILGVTFIESSTHMTWGISSDLNTNKSSLNIYGFRIAGAYDGPVACYIKILYKI